LDWIDAEFVGKMMRYMVVGFIGTGIDFGITYVMKEHVKVSKYLANSIGFSTAVVSNYLLNRYWTFGAGDENMFIQFGTFLLVSVIGLLINNGIIYLVSERLKINFYLAKMAAIVVVVFWNFFVNYYYTFRATEI
jgi:putative flippase GtrA